MASTAYARIGAHCKSELGAVGVLRLSLRPASSLISIPNSKIQTGRVFCLQTPNRNEFPSTNISVANNNQKEQVMASRVGVTIETRHGNIRTFQ